MRTVFPCNQGWIFEPSEQPDQGCCVTLPHTIGLTPANSSGCRNLLEQVQYRRCLTLPDTERGKRILLRLEGIMGCAAVFLNGRQVARSTCGYLPLVIDLTDLFRFDEDNQLQILADNRPDPDCPPGKPQGDLDFMYDGGIYRTASLITCPKLHFTDALLPGERGLFVWTDALSESMGTAGIRAEIKNDSQTPRAFTCRFTLTDDQGQLAAQQLQTVNLACAASVNVEASLSVEHPNAWSPEAPYLYRLQCEILEDGTVIDQVTQRVGLRKFEFTRDRGLIWNGTPRRLSGANYHPTFPYLGAALPDRLLYRDAKKLRDLGMKNIRSHYPFAESFLDACDELGLTLIVSNPGWQWYRDGIFAERLVENMRRIIRWQRNHPCIILWEPMPNESVVPMDIQQALHDAVHEEYPVSPCYTASDHGPTDVAYWQYDRDMLEPGMEGYDPAVSGTDKPLWVREYGDAPDNWTDQNCAWRTPRQWGDYAMVRAVERMVGMDPQCPITHYTDTYNTPNLCGFGMWPGIEHNRGYHVNPCWGGMLDLFRLRKFTAECMDSQQDRQEAGVKLFIANWWTDVSPQDVTVYSNADTVRLLIGDQVVEERHPEPIPIPHPPFIFRNVWQKYRTRDRSTLRAQALVDGKIAAEVSQTTPGAPCALRLEADLEGISFGADGEDVIVVRCYVTDADGTTVARYADDHPILFSVTGGAELVGDAAIGANPVYPQAGIACVLLRSAGHPQTVTVTARMLWPQACQRIAIRPAELTLETVASGSQTQT